MSHTILRPAGALLFAASVLAGCAQTSPARGPGGGMPMQAQGDMPTRGGMSMQMPQGVDAQMQRMQQMHERMARARTPAERQALMSEQHKLMQDGMGMMSGMQRMQPPAGSPDAQRMMEMRMQMMEKMMQMMMDRMDPTPPR